MIESIQVELLMFSYSLPDVNARLSILKVATALWKAKRPSESDLRLLAEKTAGYCGADLKVMDFVIFANCL